LAAQHNRTRLRQCVLRSSPVDCLDVPSP
jgi:hypothetical protein